ncbi:MAG: DUF4293 domain-containing protein [Bacteroidales bacterium]|jgi:uncharacterized membrane protein|nr:DUF4293 domain-containing protein [Bacteroidales bacterium]
MIQRIQTVYLIIAGLLAASLLKLRFAEMVINSNFYTFSAKGIFNNETLLLQGMPIMVIIGIIVVLHFVIIAMYKQRVWQIRLTVFTIVLLVVLFGLFLYFAYAGINETQVALKIPSVFPLVAIIFDLLALRSIRKDEALIRSLNRIR